MSYIPEPLIAMYYGRDKQWWIKSVSGFRSEGIRALRENQVKGALRITLKRSMKVLKQF